MSDPDVSFTNNTAEQKMVNRHFQRSHGQRIEACLAVTVQVWRSYGMVNRIDDILRLIHNFMWVIF